ncbi:14604_t:CDS:2, partial [Acaulospora morrowiae]
NDPSADHVMLPPPHNFGIKGVSSPSRGNHNRVTIIDLKANSVWTYYPWTTRIEVDFDQIVGKTEDIFTKLCDVDLPAYSELIENRIAVAKLANLVSSNNALENINKDLLQLTDHLSQFSKDLELIYEEGNVFFMIFEKSVSEWEKLEIMNKYSPGLFELMKNYSHNYFMTLSKTEVTMEGILLSKKKSNNKEVVLSEWINYLDISLWCDTSTIKKCKYELSRVKKVMEFIGNSKSSLVEVRYHIFQYSNYMDTIIKRLSKENVVIKSGQATKNLKSVINKIKSSYMKFLANQDVIPRANENSSDLDIYKSELVGKVGCREFMTHFASPPVFQGVRTTKHSPFLQNIKIGAGTYIDSLTFEWSDNISFKYGGNGGNISDFNLDEGESVLWAKIYQYEGGMICGLEFRTNKWKTTGILGKPINPTILEAPIGYEVVGLYGGFDKHICGIGILYSKIKWGSFGN